MRSARCPPDLAERRDWKDRPGETAILPNSELHAILEDMSGEHGKPYFPVRFIEIEPR